MNWGFVFAVAFGVLLLGFSFNHDAAAVGGTISDGPSCGAIGGSWNGVSTCTAPFSTTVGSGETLTVSPGVTLYIPFAIMQIGGTLDNYGTIATDSFATFNVNGGGVLNNYGSISVTTSLGVSGTLNNRGSITINGGGSSEIFNSGIINNSGTIQNNNTIRNFHGTINNLAGGTLNSNWLIGMNAGTINNYGAFNNAGTLNNLYGAINNFAGGSISNTGTIDNILSTPVAVLNNYCGATYTGNPPLDNPINYVACQELEFSSSTYSVSEEDASATITVVRTSGSSGTITVQYQTSDGTATAGLDYAASSGTLTFGDGVTSQTFSVPVLTDLLVEGDETVNLELTNPSGGSVLGAPGTSILTITDVVHQCAPGSYSDNGFEPCVVAPAGTFVDVSGATAPTQCPPGQFQPLTGQAQCLDSLAGSYASGTGNVFSTLCPPGQFQPLTGQAQCLDSPPGSYASGTGNTEATQCPADQYQPDYGASSCLMCPVGTVSDPGALQCTALPPVAADDTTTTDEDSAVTTNVLANDANLADSPILVSVESVSSNGQTLVNPDNTITYTPDPNFNGADSYQYRVTDASGDYAVATVSITINPVNDPPQANAGSDLTTDEGTLVTLGGSGSDIDGDTLSFSWVQTSGPAVTLSGSDTASPSFTAPQVGPAGATLVFELTISDGIATATDTISVLVNNVDVTAPEVYNQFDPATKNVVVYGVDGTDGNLGIITPVITKTKWHTSYDDENGNGYDDDSDDEHDGAHDQRHDHTGKTNAELRTYTATDSSGNYVKLVEVVKQKGSQIKVQVLSVQYGNNPAITFKSATKHFEWSTDKGGAIKELEQKMTVGKGSSKQDVDAKYDSKKNQTKIKSEKPKAEEMLPGLVLLKMGTSNGSLVISH